MAQFWNYKDADVRINQTLVTIRNAGATPLYDLVFNHVTAWCAAAANNVRKAAISTSMHQGYHWEAGRSDASKVARKAARDKRRAMLFLRMVVLNQTHAVAKTAVDLINDAGCAWQLGLLVGDCARALMPVPDLNTPAGRFQRRGFYTVNTRHLPFFPLQNALYVHFRDNVMPAIQNATTRAVYGVALRTVGNPIWRQGDSTPAMRGRFDRFGNNDDAQGLECNCWEALLFWACHGNAFTAAAGRAMYDAFNADDRSGNIRALFGTQAAFDQATARPGDILTWVNGGMLNHVAMYAGLGPGPDNQVPYLIHHLALDEDQDHLGGGEGTVHFRTVARMGVNYLNMYGPAICYYNQPFWVGLGNTAEFQRAEALQGR